MVSINYMARKYVATIGQLDIVYSNMMMQGIFKII